MQKLLAALAVQSISPDVLPPAGQAHLQHLIAPSPYNNAFQQSTPDISPNSGNMHPNVTTPTRLPATFDYTSANALSPFTLSLLGAPADPDPDPFALQQQDDRLQKTYKSTTEINDDVDELQDNIQSLIQSLGIDPTTLDSVVPLVETATGVGGGGRTSVPLPAGDVDMFSSANIGTGQDFDFDSFLMDMPRTNEEDGDLDKLAEKLDPSTVVVPKVSDSSKIGNASSKQLHAFLNEVALQDGNEGVGGGNVRVRVGVRTGVPQLHGSQAFKVPAGAASGGSGAVSGAGVGVGPGPGATTRGRKRKSDVIVDDALTFGPQEVPGAMATTTATSAATSITGNRSKRKR